MPGCIRSRSHDQVPTGEFFNLISTLMHDLAKARSQLVRLIDHEQPKGPRLCGGYHNPSCAGVNVPNRHGTPIRASQGCVKQCYHHGSYLPQSRSQGSSMTPHGFNRIAQPVHRAPFVCGKSLHRPCERPIGKALQGPSRSPQASYSCKKQQLLERSPIETGSNVEMSVDPLEPEPRQHCRGKGSHIRGGSKPSTSLQRSIDSALLQLGRRHHDCVGTQFACLLKDITDDLRERRLAFYNAREF